MNCNSWYKPQPGTRRFLAGALGLLLALGMLVMLAIPAAAAMPTIGHTFYGIATIDGSPAPNGAVVTAEINGVTYVTQAVQQVSAPGQYGWAATFMVPQDDPDTFPDKEGGVRGDTVDFYVNGIYAASYPFFGNTEGPIEYVTNLDLSANGSPVVYHDLTVNSNGCCTVTVGGLGEVAAGGSQTYSVEEGSVINLAANAGACCQFTNWSGPVAVPGNASTTVAVNADVNVTANCAELGPYNLTTTASPPAGGSVSGGGPYFCGETATVRATANAGWSFSGWSGDLGGSINPETLLMDGNKAVTATFTQNVFDLTVESNGCCTVTVTSLGTVAAGGSQTYTVPEGTIVSVTANTGDCCQFDSWSGPVAAAGNPSTTVTVNGNVTVIANCSTPGPYTLTTGVNPPEAGSVTGGGMYTCGQTATVTAVANSGWAFTGWSGDLGGNTNPESILMDGNKTVTANFIDSSTTYTLTISSSAGGSVVTPGEGSFVYAAGAEVSLEAVPDSCYNFSTWTGDVASTGSAATTITMDGDKIISAVFVFPSPDFTISLNQGWNTFSVPISLSPCMDTWGEFSTYNNLDAIIMYSFNADAKAWVQVLPETVLEPLTGYFLKMNAAGTADIVPNPDLTQPPVKNLKPGLNLVGVASEVNISVVDFLFDVYEVPGPGGTEDGYLKVINPSVNDTGDWVNDVYLRDGPVSPTVLIGNAYWVTMQYGGDLYGTSTTP